MDSSNAQFAYDTDSCATYSSRTDACGVDGLCIMVASTGRGGQTCANRVRYVHTDANANYIPQ